MIEINGMAFDGVIAGPKIPRRKPMGDFSISFVVVRRIRCKKRHRGSRKKSVFYKYVTLIDCD